MGELIGNDLLQHLAGLDVGFCIEHRLLREELLDAYLVATFLVLARGERAVTAPGVDKSGPTKTGRAQFDHLWVSSKPSACLAQQVFGNVFKAHALPYDYACVHSEARHLSFRNIRVISSGPSRPLSCGKVNRPAMVIFDEFAQEL